MHMPDGEADLDEPEQDAVFGERHAVFGALSDGGLEVALFRVFHHDAENVCIRELHGGVHRAGGSIIVCTAWR